MSYREADFKNAIIELMRDHLGYEHYCGYNIPRDYHSPLYEEMLIDSLKQVNKGIPADAINEAIYKLKNFERGSLIQKNEKFMDYLQNGIDVSYSDNGNQTSAFVRLIDYKNVDNNQFCVINQWTIVEYEEKRPDVIVFINAAMLCVPIPCPLFLKLANRFHQKILFHNKC